MGLRCNPKAETCQDGQGMKQTKSNSQTAGGEAAAHAVYSNSGVVKSVGDIADGLLRAATVRLMAMQGQVTEVQTLSEMQHLRAAHEDTQLLAEAQRLGLITGMEDVKPRRQDEKRWRQQRFTVGGCRAGPILGCARRFT